MKCINNKIFCIFAWAFFIGCILTGCGGKTYEMAYSPDYPVSSYRLDSPVESADMAEPFAKELCVVDKDVSDGTDVDMSQSEAAALFCLDNNQTMYAKNVHE